MNLMLLSGWLVGAALPVAVGPATAPSEPECLLRVKFEAIEGPACRDEISGLPVVARNVESLSGVDGLGVRFLFDYRAGIASRVEIPLTPALKAADPAALSIELWLSPDDIRHAVMLTSGGPVAVRWRLEHRMWFTGRTVDGEDRLVQTRPGAISPVTFPEPTWYHYLATYDGQVGTIYINGSPAGQARWKDKKPLQPFREPLVMGGEEWERYRGGVDELAIWGRALTAAEAAARYAWARQQFQPAPRPAKRVAGTLDGGPFDKDWRAVPLKSGSIQVSNTGLVSLTSRNPRWGREGGGGTFGLLNADGMKDRFWTDVTGRMSVEYGGRAVLELTGACYRALQVQQRVEVTPDDEVRFRFALWPVGRDAPALSVSWPFHLWPTAVPFVGFDKTGRQVRGRVLDLAEPFVFTRDLELTLIGGGNRLLVQLPPGWGYMLPATREPTAWLGGYCTFYGRLEPLEWKGWADWSQQNPYRVEFALRLVPDEKPPVLSEADAVEVTPERPFDFSALYQPDASRVYLEPIGRDVPIFSHTEDVEFRVHLPTPLASELPACEYAVRDAYTGQAVTSGRLSVEQRWWEFNASVSFKAPKPSVYVISLRCVTEGGKVIAELEQEAAVVGPIPQPEAPAGQELKLVLVDEVDCTQEDTTHAFYSRSGQSRVVDTPAGRARQTLDHRQMQRLGTTDLDWFGYQFQLKNPAKVHVVEVIYPDLDGQTMGINVFEPGTQAIDGKPECRSRVLSGVSTGGVYPASHRLQRFRTIYFPGAPWCAVAISNIHCGSYADGPPAAASRIRLYELAEELPRLPGGPAGPDRLVGVYAESGDLAMGAFGYDNLRGERWGNMGIPKGHFYRAYYRAVENLIRYMRYRGDTVYGYGAYRYRTALFPSRRFPPAHEVREGDLLALVARMFQYNDLKVLPAVQANQPLPIARLFRTSQYDVIEGKKDSVHQVSSAGLITAGHFGFMYVNPFHPQAQAEWMKLAAELAERYGRWPSVAGVGWLGSIWDPTLLRMGYHLPKDRVESFYFGYTYDDETMRQFAAEEKLDLPGRIGDPNRFRERYEWIMKHAKDRWVAFRCRRLAAMYKQFASAVHAVAPSQKFYVVNQHPGFLSNAVVASPLETWRLYGDDPREYAGSRQLVYVHCVPDGSGLNIYEHGSMPREWMSQVRPFLDDPELYQAVEQAPATGRFLHRQFFENRLNYDVKRPWVFGRGHWPGHPNMLTCNFYPQPGGRHLLEDFALMMAHGTPELILWMWCDGSVPMGHEDALREFAAVYRALPLGRYETVSRTSGVFVRRLKDGPIYYAVNTNRQPAVAELSLGGSTAQAVDLVTGRALPIQAGRLRLALEPAQITAVRVVSSAP